MKNYMLIWLSNVISYCLKMMLIVLCHMGDGKGLSDHNTADDFLIKLDRKPNKQIDR